MSNPDHIHEIIAGALFDFAGFLTSLPKERAVTFSGSHNANPAVTLLTEWAKKRGLQLGEANVKGWESALVAPTEAAAMAATVPAVDYLDGVNIADLTKALVWLGVATGGQEEMGARLSWYVNQITSAVLRHKELWPPQAPVAGQPAEPSPADISLQELHAEVVEMCNNLDKDDRVRAKWMRMSLNAVLDRINERLKESEPQPATKGTARTDLVPGEMRCAKCNFQLTRVTLAVNLGRAVAGDNKTEPCPNGCGPLWPVTWEQYAHQALDAAERMAERAIAAESKLAALAAPKGDSNG